MNLVVDVFFSFQKFVIKSYEYQLKSYDIISISCNVREPSKKKKERKENPSIFYLLLGLLYC